MRPVISLTILVAGKELSFLTTFSFLVHPVKLRHSVEGPIFLKFENNDDFFTDFRRS